MDLTLESNLLDEICWPGAVAAEGVVSCIMPSFEEDVKSGCPVGNGVDVKDHLAREHLSSFHSFSNASISIITVHLSVSLMSCLKSGSMLQSSSPARIRLRGLPLPSQQ